MPDPAPRTLAGIDISVLDNDVLTVAGLRADAASHPVTVDEQTVSELYTSAASAEVERLRTGVAELADDSVLAQGHSALVDAAAVLLCLAQRLGDTRPQARDRCNRLADELTTHAGSLKLAADRLAVKRDQR